MEINIFVVLVVLFLVVWAIFGIYDFVTYNTYNWPTPKSVFLGGPAIWLLGIFIFMLNIPYHIRQLVYKLKK